MKEIVNNLSNYVLDLVEVFIYPKSLSVDETAHLKEAIQEEIADFIRRKAYDLVDKVMVHHMDKEKE